MTNPLNIMYNILFLSLVSKPNLDLVFIIGASGDDSENRFKKQKEITKHLLTSYDTSAGKTHVGVISNGRPSQAAIAIGKYHGDTLISEIDGLANSNTEMLIDALNFANDDMFTARNGARPGVRKSLVLFVNDEKEKSDADALALLGKTLRGSGINVIVIGVNPSLESGKLKAVSPLNEVFFFPPLLEEIDMALYPVVRATYPGN